MKEKIAGVYKIENLNNHKCYIGSSTDCIRRVREHKRNLVNGCHPARDMQEDFDNGDNLKATILERLPAGTNHATLLLHENRYILEYDSIQNGYNKNPSCNEELTKKRIEKKEKAAQIEKYLKLAAEPTTRGLEIEKNCKFCGKLISDLSAPDADYYKHISVKYCPECRKISDKVHTLERVHEYRKRKKELNRERDTQLELLKQENELLRQRIAALK